MTKNEKCKDCEHLTQKGVLTHTSQTEGSVNEPNYWCAFKSINLNNIIVKNCTNYRKDRMIVKQELEEASEEEFTPEEVFKNLPPRQTKINFFR